MCSLPELQLALGEHVHNPRCPLSSGPVISWTSFCSLIPATSRHSTSQSTTFIRLKQNWRRFKQLWLLHEASSLDTALSPLTFPLNEALFEKCNCEHASKSFTNLSLKGGRIGGMWKQTELSKWLLIEFISICGLFLEWSAWFEKISSVFHLWRGTDN